MQDVINVDKIHYIRQENKLLLEEGNYAISEVLLKQRKGSASFFGGWCLTTINA